MSRELLGIGIVTVLCIALVPFFKQSIHRELQPKAETPQQAIIIQSDVAKTDRPKTVVLIRNSFPPKTFAGSELSDYEAMKYLQRRGHDIKIFLRTWSTDNYDGLPLRKLNFNDPYCKNLVNNADVLVISDFAKDDEDFLNRHLEERRLPVFVNIHVANAFGWFLQQKTPFKTTVIFNSHMTQDNEHTIHSNFIMYPYVNIAPLKSLRHYTVQSSTVTLINCNRNKGGDMLVSLAKKLPNTHFLGVKGGYGSQVVDTTLPNLTYVETTPDIKSVLKKTGILIMPSNSETWGRTAVEAMAAGIPVIHSESQGLIECVAGAGIMCAQSDEDAWGEAIERINRDPAFREQLRQRGFKRVEEIDLLQKQGRQEMAVRIERI